MWYQKEAGGIFWSLDIKRDEYDSHLVLFCASIHTYPARMGYDPPSFWRVIAHSPARAQQTLKATIYTYNKQKLVQKLHVSLCVDDCCTVVLLRIESHSRGLPYVLFLLLSLFAYTTHTLYIAVSSVHVIICTHSDRNYKQLWDIIYHTSTFELYTYVSSSPGEALHSLFFLACPPFAIFVGLRSRFCRLARLSVFSF